MAGAHQLSDRITWLAATRLRPTLQTEREASMMVHSGSVSKRSRAVSRAGAGIEPSMRVKFREEARRWYSRRERKDVHWEKMIVLVEGSREEA